MLLKKSLTVELDSETKNHGSVMRDRLSDVSRLLNSTVVLLDPASSFSHRKPMSQNLVQVTRKPPVPGGSLCAKLENSSRALPSVTCFAWCAFRQSH